MRSVDVFIGNALPARCVAGGDDAVRSAVPLNVDDQKQVQIFGHANGGFSILLVDAGLLDMEEAIKENLAGGLEADAMLIQICRRLLRIPHERLVAVEKVDVHSLNVYTLYGRRQLLESELASALNFRGFGRILYVQTNLSAALCAIRVAERGVGLQPTFSLD